MDNYEKSNAKAEKIMKSTKLERVPIEQYNRFIDDGLHSTEYLDYLEKKNKKKETDRKPESGYPASKWLIFQIEKTITL